MSRLDWYTLATLVLYAVAVIMLAVGAAMWITAEDPAPGPAVPRADARDTPPPRVVTVSRGFARTTPPHPPRVRVVRVATPTPTKTATPKATPAPEPEGEAGTGAGVWAQLRACESSGDYRAVSPGGTYRGAYQFDHATWASVGGHGDPAAAPPAEQDARARALHAARGWSPWPQCAARLGLLP